MPYYAVEDFKSGLDVRRSKYTSVAGTLQHLVNAHITRGGDVERRKAFVPAASCYDVSFGLLADADGFLTFGSEVVVEAGGNAPPIDLETGGSLPASAIMGSMRYQRLQAPTGANMTGIAASELFGGKAYVAANYDDGTQWHFYDGELVTDWGSGLVRNYMINNAGIAAHLTAAINAGGIYTATSDGNVITVVGPEGVDYAVDVDPENTEGGTDDQAILTSFVAEPVTAVEEVRAIGNISILGGTVSPGVNKITSVKADATELLAAAVNYAATEQQTALDVASAINANFLSHGYAAYSVSGRVYIVAPVGQGATANQRVVTAVAAGNVLLAEGSFRVNGVAGGEITMITAGGVPIIGAAIAWTTSNEATATAVAAAVNAFASVPKYNARAIGESVFLAPAAVSSNDPATTTIAVTTSGGVDAGAGDLPPVYGDPRYPTRAEDGYEVDLRLVLL